MKEIQEVHEGDAKYTPSSLPAKEILKLPAIFIPVPNQGNSLKRRIEMIVSNKAARHLSWKMRVMLVLIGFVVAPLSLLAESGDTDGDAINPDQNVISKRHLPVSAKDQTGVREDAFVSDEDEIQAKIRKHITMGFFDSFDMGVQDPRRLSHLTGVSSLGLKGPKINNDALMQLKSFEHLESLGFLDTNIQAQGMRHLKGTARLTSLSLVGSDVTDEWLKNLPELESLRTLNLAGSHVTNAGLNSLAKFPQLEWLSLEYTNIGVGGLEVLAQLPRLKHLNLRYTLVTDADLSNLRHVPLLESFSLASPNVRGDGICHLQHAKSLRDLSFVGPSVTDQWMFGIENLGNVTWLSLYSTKVTAKGLSAIKKWVGLTNLYLNHNAALGDDAILYLRDLYLLETIELNATAFSSQGLSQLKKSLPDTSVCCDTKLSANGR